MSWTAAFNAGRLDDLGRLDSGVHRLDARAKILATAAFLVVVMSFPRYEVSALMPLFLFPLGLGMAAGLPAGYLLRKVAVASPFAILVGMANPLLDPAPVVVVAGHGVSGGWLSFVSILARFVLTVWGGLVLVATTGMHPLCAGLERLGMPRLFSVQILFLHRYLFVIADEGVRLARAVAVRGAGRKTVPLRVYGSLLGQWLLRSMDRALRIHQAMCARGFDGQVRVLRRGGFGWREGVFVLAWAGFFLLARTWNLSDGLGRIVLHLTR